MKLRASAVWLLQYILCSCPQDVKRRAAALWLRRCVQPLGVRPAARYWNTADPAVAAAAAAVIVLAPMPSICLRH